MNGNEELDDFLRDVAPMTPPEQREMLLHYFTALMEGMDERAIVGMRAHLVAKFPPGPDQDTITEVIDGHLALRAVKR